MAKETTKGKGKTPDRYTRLGRPKSGRGTRAYTGPDGESFDERGAPASRDTYTGPDGITYNDHELI